MTYEIHNDRLTVTVASRGAELYSVKAADGVEYIWQGKEPYWTSHAINIFPICGRLVEGKYTYHGKEYSLDCHGFARVLDFTISPESDAARLIFVAVSDDQTKRIYPFDFELKYTFTLEDNKLTCRTDVKNTGSDTLPFTLGGHPGFNVPLVDGLDFSDYTVDLGDCGALDKVVLSDTCFITGRTAKYPLRDGRFIDLRHDLFDNDAIFFVNAPKSARLASAKDSHAVTLSCPEVNNLGLWHNNKTDAPFVCIEPWLGLPGDDGYVADMETKPHMIRLAPNESYGYFFDLIFD